MSLRPPIIVSPSGSFGNSYPRQGYEAAGQTFKSSAFLTQTAGKLVGAASNADNLVGMSQQPAEGVTDGLVMYHRFNSTTVLEMTMDDALDGGEAPGTYVAAIADINGKFGFAIDASSGIYYVNQDEATAFCILLGFRDPIGTVQPRAIVQVLRERLIEAA